jgi:hypothetical protein
MANTTQDLVGRGSDFLRDGIGAQVVDGIPYFYTASWNPLGNYFLQEWSIRDDQIHLGDSMTVTDVSRDALKSITRLTPAARRVPVVPKEAPDRVGIPKKTEGLPPEQPAAKTERHLFATFHTEDACGVAWWPVTDAIRVSLLGKTMLAKSDIAIAPALDHVAVLTKSDWDNTVSAYLYDWVELPNVDFRKVMSGSTSPVPAGVLIDVRGVMLTTLSTDGDAVTNLIIASTLLRSDFMSSVAVIEVGVDLANATFGVWSAWTDLPITPGSNWCINLHAAADGTAQLFAVNPTGNDDVEAYRRKPGGGWVAIASPLAGESLTQPPGVFYTSDAAPTPAKADPTADAFVTFERGLVWRATDARSRVRRAFFGRARRTTLERMTMPKSLLFGILEGPPPIPQENLNLDPKHGKPTFEATVTVGMERSETNTWDFSSSVAGIVSLKSEFGFWVFVSATLESTTGYSYSEKRVTTSATFDSFDFRPGLEQARSGEWIVSPDGYVLLLSMDATGFTLEFVDGQGVRVPDTPVVVQLFIQNPTVMLKSYTLPRTGPQPGKIDTYLVSEQTQLALRKASFATSGATSELSWDKHETTTKTLKFTDSEQQSHGFFIDAKATLGLTVDALGPKGSFAVGLQVKINGSMSSQKATGLAITVKFGLPTDDRVAGSFRPYSFDVHFLRPSPEWARNFRESLVTPDWPPPGGLRKANQNVQQLLEKFVTNDAGLGNQSPWRITYSLTTMPERVSELEAAAARLRVPLPRLLLNRISALGIETAADLRAAVTNNALPLSAEEAECVRPLLD